MPTAAARSVGGAVSTMYAVASASWPLKQPQHTYATAHTGKASSSQPSSESSSTTCGVTRPTAQTASGMRRPYESLTLPRSGCMANATSARTDSSEPLIANALCLP
eukprot:7321105-Prymnesium_polylepis.2